ncbi:MAG: aspartate carbamoyltransferase catalytic subunit [Actinobacteria bacterium]|nr:aspartate carbamoyltransferase catalytic subunit [Actinomycetota bacterium]
MLNTKNILSIDDLSTDDIDTILSNADFFLEVLDREVKKVPALRGKTIVSLFFEPSTRTRTSFEIAGKRLNADVVNFSPSMSSLKKGESIIDTVRTILSMKVDLLIVRHSDSGIPKFISERVNIPVINAGDGTHEHPTQALLDLYTIRKKFGSVEGLKVAIVGDILHSRVAKSNIKLFKKMKMEVILVAPSMLLPEKNYFDEKVKHSIDEVINKVDVLYMLRMQFERQQNRLYPSIREYNRFLSLDIERFRRLKPESIVMHPGPVNRGIEISGEVMDLIDKYPERIKIEEQVSHGLAVRMALIYLMLSLSSEDLDSTRS